MLSLRGIFSDNAKRYRAIAWFLASLGVIALLGSAYSYWFVLHDPGGISPQSTDWGTFGDFIGGLAGTIIALATLVALALTLHLQAKELTETRQQLQRQADAARFNIELTKQIECRRIRPILKLEWFRSGDGYSTTLNMTNVGLGAAIVRKVQLFVRGDFIGEFDSYSMKSRDLWRTVLNSACPEVKSATIRLQGLGDLTRALAVGERQWIAALDFAESSITEKAHSEIEKTMEPVVFFLSLAGEELDTRSQFNLPPLGAGLDPASK